jgi:uncharacterized protein DUF2490
MLAALWSELDVSINLAQGVDFTWAFLSRDSITRATGVDLNVQLSPHLILTPSYYFAESRAQGGPWVRSHLPTLAATFVLDAKRCVITDRNRVVGVFSEGSRFWVYQNRPRLDCRLGSADRAASVFLWDELSWYSIAGRNRNRVASGIRVPVSERWAFDVFYLQQHDVRAQPRSLQVLGLTLEVALP